MPLTGKDIARIAQHIEQCVKEFPEPKILVDYDWNAEVVQQKWELELQSAIESDSLLSVSWEDIRELEFVDWLIDYFSTVK